MTVTKLPLTIPTNRTTRGPVFRREGEKIVLEYDYEEDGGNTILSLLAFSEVLDFEYRQVSCCDPSDVLGSKELLCLTQSNRLTTVLNQWKQSVGWQEWQSKQGGAVRFKHFKAFFDDAGCIDVIASDFQVLQ